MAACTVLLAWIGLATAQEASPATETEGPETVQEHTSVDETPRHPFIFEMERAGYDAHAEIAAAVGDGAFDDAVRMILDTGANEQFGLIPDVRDQHLLLGYPEFVLRCVELFPDIRQGLRAESDLGELRMNAAIAAGEPDRVRSVAYQFAGAPAAVQSYRWLGDRALSAGKFRDALGMYQAALRWGDEQDREGLLSRYRLAMAMTGRLSEVPANRPLEYGGMNLAADEMERFVHTRVAQWKAKGDTPGGDPAPEINRSIPAAQFQAGVLADVPVSAPWSIFREAPDCPIDWSGRAASFAPFGDQLIVASRSEVQSVSLATGRQRWSQVFDGFRAFPAQWTWTAHRILAHDGRIFVRRLPRGLPRLACLDANRGKVLWETAPAFCIASDPVYADGRIAVLEIDVDDPFGRQSVPTNPFSAIRQYRQTTRPLQLSLLLLDAETGHLIDRFPLARFHNWWDVLFPCRASSDQNALIVSLGGTTVCAGLDGRVRWVRRHEYQLPKNTLGWFAAYHSPPLVRDDRVVVSQPGVADVQCLDVATGRLCWRCDATDLRRLVGTSGDRLVLQRASALEALSWEDGSLLWTHSGIGPTEAVLCSESSILFADWPESDTGVGLVELIWLAAEDGHVIQRSPLPGVLADRRIAHMPRLGPMIPIGTNLVLGCDRGQRRSSTRTVYRLAPIEVGRNRIAPAAN